MLKRIFCAALASSAISLSGATAAQELKIALIAGKTGPLKPMPRKQKPAS